VGERLVVAAGHGVRERAEEEGATAGERIKDVAVEIGEVELLGRRRQGQVCAVGQVQREPSVVAGQRRVPAPDHLAARRELVQQRRAV